MATSQNGWSAEPADSSNLHLWQIPTKDGVVQMKMRRGAPGLILAVIIQFIANRVEPVKGRVLDDWGYAYRPVRGSETDLSNHASGTAADVNALRHVLGKRFTWAYKVLYNGRKRVAGRVINQFINRPVFRGTVRWGRNYHNREDSMHFEINKGPYNADVVNAGSALAKRKRGKAILALNPSQRQYFK